MFDVKLCELLRCERLAAIGCSPDTKCDYAAGRSAGGFVILVVVGLAGSFLGAFLCDGYGWYHHGEFEGILGCAVGAMVLIALFRFLSGTTAEAGGRENYDL